MDCTKAIELDPEFDAPYLLRGRAYTKLGKMLVARRDLETVIKLAKNPQLIDLEKHLVGETTDLGLTPFPVLQL